MMPKVGGCLIWRQKTSGLIFIAILGGRLICEVALYASSYYCPPSESSDSFKLFQESLARVCNEAKSDNIWLGGDFNLPDIEWSLPAVKAYANKGVLCGELLDSCNEAGLTQSDNPHTTRMGQTISLTYF